MGNITLCVDIYAADVVWHNFSGGEAHCRINPFPFRHIAKDLYISAMMTDASDIMRLLLLTDAARRQFGDIPVHLTCPYLPYARQDRVCAPGEALSLRVMCDLINAQRYASVTVWDCHSDVGPALLDRCINKPALDFLRYLDVGNCVLVAPDAGAIKKVSGIAKALGCPMVRADKTRDPRDGSITGTVAYSEHVGKADFLVVDDICDGGRTFIELAKVLQPLTDGRVLLYITHSIFSAGFDELSKHIDHIYTANPFGQVPGDFVTIIKA
jgi:ribose-phosphate pyrophosphokinase